MTFVLDEVINIAWTLFRFQLWNKWCKKVRRGPVSLLEQHRALSQPGHVTGKKHSGSEDVLCLHQAYIAQFNVLRAGYTLVHMSDIVAVLVSFPDT